MKEVSVVISTYAMDRLSHVLGCVESLKRQTLLPKEIILVLDPDKNLIEFYKSHVPDSVKVVASQRYGLSNARNFGAKNAKGEIIAFIDDDTFATENWLKNLINNYESPHIVGAGGLVKPIWENKRPLWFPEELDWVIGCSYKGHPRYKTYIENPVGSNMSFRKNVFDEVGYFKTDIGRFGKTLISGEDREFSMRILRNLKGSRIIYDPSTIVYHRIERSKTCLKYFVKRLFHAGLSISLMANCFKSDKRSVLTVESSYLEYLFRVSIPTRLKQIYKLKNVLQIFILLISILLVITAYSIARFIS